MKSRKSTEIRKEEIVRAALCLVEQNGLDKLNIADIALAVNLVPGAIYRHFKSKEDIIAALIDFADRSLQNNISKVMDSDGSAIAKLELLFELHVKLLKEEAAIPKILYFILSSDRNPESKGSMLSAVGSYVQQVKKILLQGQKKGEVNADVDVMAAAILFLGMVQPLAILGQVDPKVLDEYPSKLWHSYQRSIVL